MKGDVSFKRAKIDFWPPGSGLSAHNADILSSHRGDVVNMLANSTSKTHRATLALIWSHIYVHLSSKFTL